MIAYWIIHSIFFAGFVVCLSIKRPEGEEYNKRNKILDNSTLACILCALISTVVYIVVA